jgi:hypothetical protein
MKAKQHLKKRKGSISVKGKPGIANSKKKERNKHKY